MAENKRSNKAKVPLKEGAQRLIIATVRNMQKTNSIDQLKEFEAKLRRQMLRDRMDDSRVQESFENGSMPQIHVSIGALAASAPPGVRVSGD